MATCPIQFEHLHSIPIDQDKRANLPSPNPTRSFWAHSSPDANPLAHEGSTGPLTADADMCIIGSGITGVGVAYHLSEAIATNKLQSPLKVVILEAREFCTGATGRNGGHLTPAAFAGFDARMNTYGVDEAKRSYALEAHTTSSLVRLIQQHGWSTDVDLVQGGHVTLLLTDEEVEGARRDLEAAAHAGWPLDNVVELSKAEVEATYGAHYPAVKFPGYNLWPLKLVAKLYGLAKSRQTAHFDLSLHTHTSVTAVERARSSESTRRACVVSTPRGTIACSRVVHATNGYASHLLPFLAGKKGIVPVRGQVIATRACVDADIIRFNSWSGHQGHQYWFPRPVKTPIDAQQPLVILGGGRIAAQPMYETYVDDDTTCNPVVGEALRAFLPTVFRGKFEAGQAPEMEWTGIMGYTDKKIPFVGPVDKLTAARQRRNDTNEYEGQYVAAGYTGHGMPCAFGCAEVVAQMIVAELTGTKWIQPEWFPTPFLTWEECQKKDS